MTVEQPALPQKVHAQRAREHDALFFEKVKEVTGVSDENVIRQACEACKDNTGNVKVEDVVTVLLSDESIHLKAKQKLSSSVVPLPAREDVDKSRYVPQGTGTSTSTDQEEEANENKNQSATKQEQGNVPFGPQNKNQGVIDLTGEQDELQKAIKASLEDTQGIGILGGQVSREEQDISRVLEQSLAESKAGTKRKRGDVWFVDPLNPHERKRQDGCPVGLKNVGNTCWFSAVIQSLFHLRKFRHLVVNFQIPKETTQGNSTETRNLRFMQEMRYLFALMVGSKKKYVDPSKAVEILKEAFSTSSAAGVGDSQQDISEFQHKLLEWLEDAFKSRSSRPSSPSQNEAGDTSDTGEREHTRNPMVELFYGQYRAEGINEGKGFSNEETFGQFPLQVNGFRDIHESLEAATAQGEIETVSGNTTQKSGQELWFTRLPPMLTFELSRFQFNQQLGRPEKIHNKIEFPLVIYMDRYMECNKLETRQRREQVKKLREELSILYAKLDKFNHYGSGSKKVPLQDVLSYALEFAHSKPENSNSNLPQDIEMESPKPGTSSSSNMMTDSPTKSSGDVTMTATPVTPPRSVKSTALITNPAPRQVSDGELRVLQDCLHRWRTEVEQDVRELQENINRLETTVNGIYSDDAMLQNPYHLHAVLVHEGQAASGHYWAYIYDYRHKEWLKFNDTTVSGASWEDLMKESVGGYHNASAYCLMYVNKTKLDHPEFCTDMPEQSEVEKLPEDLQRVVIEDNKKFCLEIDEWDREQAFKASGASVGGSVASSSDSDVTTATEHKPNKVVRSLSTNTVGTQVPAPPRQNLQNMHAEISYRVTRQAIADAIGMETFVNKGPVAALELAISSEVKRTDHLLSNFTQKLPREDLRLMSPAMYLRVCGAPVVIIDRFLYEQFAYCPMLDGDDRAKEIKKAAADMLEKQRLGLDGEQIEKLTMHWHEKFHQFRRIAFFFVKGLQLFNEERYETALPYLIHTYSQNHILIEKSCQMRGLQEKLVNFYRRQCLLHLNDKATHNFENQENVAGSLELMNNLVVPCLSMLLTSGYQDDTCAAEEMREKWCAFLGQEIGEQKIEKLQDFLSKLFEPPSENKVAHIPSATASDLKKLYDNYLDVMNIAYESGYIDRAAESK